MIRFILIAYGITSALFLLGCSEILEPVNLYGAKQNVSRETGQKNLK